MSLDTTVLLLSIISSTLSIGFVIKQLIAEFNSSIYASTFSWFKILIFLSILLIKLLNLVTDSSVYFDKSTEFINLSILL